MTPEQRRYTTKRITELAQKAHRDLINDASKRINAEQAAANKKHQAWMNDPTNADKIIAAAVKKVRTSDVSYARTLLNGQPGTDLSKAYVGVNMKYPDATNFSESRCQELAIRLIDRIMLDDMFNLNLAERQIAALLEKLKSV